MFCLTISNIIVARQEPLQYKHVADHNNYDILSVKIKSSVVSFHCPALRLGTKNKPIKQLPNNAGESPSFLR